MAPVLETVLYLNFSFGTSTQVTHALTRPSVPVHTLHDKHLQAYIPLSERQADSNGCTEQHTVATVLASNTQRHSNFVTLPSSKSMMCKPLAVFEVIGPGHSAAKKRSIGHRAAVALTPSAVKKSDANLFRAATSHVEHNFCNMLRHPKARNVPCAFRLSCVIWLAAAG